MDNYYNTTDLNGEQLREARSNAMTQGDIILAFFKKNPDKTFIPSEIHEQLFTPRTPLTSVRRSITNLTASGDLVKTNEQRTGTFGKKSFAWKLAGSKTSADDYRKASGG